MSEQYDLFGGVPPHVRQSDTSLAAAVSVKESAGTIRAKVLATLKAEGAATCDRLEEITGLSHQTCSARVRELVLKGKIKDSGRREKTRSGRGARVYVPVGGNR